jgi:hypothetical protein
MAAIRSATTGAAGANSSASHPARATVFAASKSTSGDIGLDLHLYVVKIVAFNPSTVKIQF